MAINRELWLYIVRLGEITDCDLKRFPIDAG
jgi:hypothetical protein